MPGILSITNSTFGSDFFYYFYDWKVSTADKYCISDLAPATALIDLGTATRDIRGDDAAIVVSPNPTDGRCSIAFTSSGIVDFELTNMEGSLLFARKNVVLEQQNCNLDLSAYAPGVYLLRVVQDGRFYTKKIIRL
jgi:hypothetical protein